MLVKAYYYYFFSRLEHLEKKKINLIKFIYKMLDIIYKQLMLQSPIILLNNISGN